MNTGSPPPEVLAVYRSAGALRIVLLREGRPLEVLSGPDPLDPAAADDLATLAVHDLCERLNLLVARNLYGGLPCGDNGLRVPDELVEESLGLVLGAPVR